MNVTEFHHAPMQRNNSLVPIFKYSNPRVVSFQIFIINIIVHHFNILMKTNIFNLRTVFIRFQSLFQVYNLKKNYIILKKLIVLVQIK